MQTPGNPARASDSKRRGIAAPCFSRKYCPRNSSRSPTPLINHFRHVGSRSSTRSRCFFFRLSPFFYFSSQLVLRSVTTRRIPARSEREIDTRATGTTVVQKKKKKKICQIVENTGNLVCRDTPNSRERENSEFLNFPRSCI